MVSLLHTRVDNRTFIKTFYQLPGELIDELVRKLKNYFSDRYKVGYKPDYVERILLAHDEQNTHVIVTDDEHIVGYVRWNVVQNTAEVLDLFIDSHVNGIEILRDMMSEGVRRFPQLRYVKFERHSKKNAKDRIYDIFKMGKIKEQQ